MSRARTQDYQSQTAAMPEYPHKGPQGSGCLSGFMIPPIAVLIVSFFLAAFAMRQPIPAQAQIAIPTGSTETVEIVLASPKEEEEEMGMEVQPTPFYALTPTPAPLMAEIVS